MVGGTAEKHRTSSQYRLRPVRYSNSELPDNTYGAVSVGTAVKCVRIRFVVSSVDYLRSVTVVHISCDRYVGYCPQTD